jgi:hypothetical protein
VRKNGTPCLFKEQPGWAREIRIKRRKFESKEEIVAYPPRSQVEFSRVLNRNKIKENQQLLKLSASQMADLPKLLHFCHMKPKI